MKSRKKLPNREKKKNQEKYFEIEKKKLNREKYFRIEKNISESRKLFQNQEIFCYKNQEKIFGIEYFYIFA